MVYIQINIEGNCSSYRFALRFVIISLNSLRTKKIKLHELLIETVNMSSDKVVEQLLQKLDRQCHMYGSVLVSCYLCKEGSDWVNKLALFKPLSKDCQEPLPVKWDYGNAVLLKTIITIKELIEIVKKLSGTQPVDLKIADIAIKIPEGSLEFKCRHYSNNDYDFWGFEGYQYKPTQNSGYSSFPLTSVSLPLFPDFESVLESFFEIYQSDDYAYSKKMLFFLPDYGCRIKDIRFKKVKKKNREQIKLTISIETKYYTYSDIIGKVYASNKAYMPTQTDIIFENNKNSATITLDFEPEKGQFILLSKKDGCVLDEKRIHYCGKCAIDDCSDDLSDEKILELIKNGENQKVEFKAGIDGKKLQEIARTAVAFANSDGGIIIIGVDNNGIITGYQKKPNVNPKDVITDNISSMCKPRIIPKVQCRQLDGKEIIVVTVAKSKSQLYVYENNQYCLRVNATNKIMDPVELIEFCRDRGHM
jgi:hypothetical protein